MNMTKLNQYRKLKNFGACPFYSTYRHLAKTDELTS